MVLISLNNDAEFDEAVKLPTLSVIHFCCNWSAQCQHMNSILEGESERIKDAKFYSVDAESAFTISNKYNIVAVPTFLLFRNNQQVERVEGANAEELSTKIDVLLKKGDEKEDKTTPVEDAEQLLHTKLKTLTNLYPVMLFMKGTRDEPKCGFSRQIIEILNEVQADYQCFNILGNEEVRQGLKTFSNWPTYPQLFIKGELVGGLDIVKEMKENGELQPMLQRMKLEDRLAALIREHRCMIFMKGDRNNPRCGFSRQLIQILQATGVEFKTFDILKDEVVREGLKIFSKWPTYPQVYVDGELVGGLDIIKELQETGELNAVLKIQS